MTARPAGGALLLIWPWASSLLACASSTTFITHSIDEGLEKIKEVGYTVARLGEAASLLDMDAAARKLLELKEGQGGSYNGGGGVTRETIEGSGFLDGSAGAPSELPVNFHNEMSYSATVPRRVAFAMVTPAPEGGLTLLVDNVQLTGQLSQALRARLAHVGVLYMRNLSNESGRGAHWFYDSWQQAFRTNDTEEAMTKGNTNKSILRWNADGSGMQHFSWTPAFFKHPTHGELLFTNIMDRHGSWMDDHPVFGKMPLPKRPFHTVWGDGAEFSEAEFEEIRKVHKACTVQVHLEKGDIIVMDNLRVAHGRTPYKGYRQIGLMLSEMVPRVTPPPPWEFAALREGTGGSCLANASCFPE